MIDLAQGARGERGQRNQGYRAFFSFFFCKYCLRSVCCHAVFTAVPWEGLFPEAEFMVLDREDSAQSPEKGNVCNERHIN